MCQTQNRNLSIGTFPVQCFAERSTIWSSPPLFCNIADFFLLWPLSSLFSIILLRGQKGACHSSLSDRFPMQQKQATTTTGTLEIQNPFATKLCRLVYPQNESAKICRTLKNCKKRQKKLWPKSRICCIQTSEKKFHYQLFQTLPRLCKEISFSQQDEE